MISIEEMKKAVGKNVEITYVFGGVIKDKCTYYMSPAEDEEEPALFIGENWYIEQSQIKTLKILD